MIKLPTWLKRTIHFRLIHEWIFIHGFMSPPAARTEQAENSFNGFWQT